MRRFSALLRLLPWLRAGEEKSPMAAAVTSGAVVSLPADVKAAASIATSLSAAAPSPRLAAAPPMPSPLAPVQGSVATPEELEERLRFYARQIKSFRRASLLYSSPELTAKVREIEEDYQTAIRQFYCRPPPSSPSFQSAAAVQPTSRLQSSAAAQQPTPGLQGIGDASAPAHASEGLGDASASAPGLQAFQGFSERLVLVLVPEHCDDEFEDQPPPEPVPERFEKELVLVLASEPRDKRGPPDSASVSEGPVGAASASEGSPGSASASEGSPGSASASEGSPGTVKAKPDSKPPEFHRVSGGSSTLHGPLLCSADLQIEGPLLCLADLQTEGPLLCSADLQTVSSFVAAPQGLYVPAGLLVFAFAAGRQGLYIPAGHLVFAFPTDAGLHGLYVSGLYVSAGFLVFAFAAIAGRHGLYASVSLHVFAASLHGLYAFVGLHAFAGDRPGLCLSGPDTRLNCVPARDDLLTFVPAQGDVLVTRLNFVPARGDVLVTS
ncbi:hypothetical protein CRENBAI_021405 [Crenichthys baileyi]|uniref:Uncharacterized protein n=1 Tax=Crenichthys baileyi TaxID=28760 RepID=A0AAV9SA74_9TELE